MSEAEFRLRVWLREFGHLKEKAFIQDLLTVLLEIETLREVMLKHHLDPNRCPNFPKGEQCGLKRGHEGNCKWANGD